MYNNNFDPSKMDPKVLMELSNLIRQLPPDKISQMQTLMHNMMAGYDVQKEMEEFEKSLPPGFREKLLTAMASQGINPATGMGMGGFQQPSIQPMSSASQAAPGGSPTATGGESSAELSLHEARITILRAVADGRMAPEEAERLLFNAS